MDISIKRVDLLYNFELHQPAVLSSSFLLGLFLAILPPEHNSPGIAHRHDALLCGRNRRDADLRVDIENGCRRPALGPRLHAHARQHGIVIVVGTGQVLLEDDFLAGVAREGVAGSAGAGLSLGEEGVADEAGFDDGHPARGAVSEGNCLGGREGRKEGRKGKSILEARGKLQVDAHAAVLAGISGRSTWTD